LGTIDVVIDGVTKKIPLTSAPKFSKGCTGSGCVVDQKLTYVRDYTRKGRIACGPGKVAMRVIGGATTDAILCFSGGDSRIQWREIPGMRTQ
jgi:hypothetical protein